MPEFMTTWRELSSRAWADPAFRQRLMTEPDAVLAENGLELPAGMQFKVVENTPTLLHLVLCVDPAQLPDLAPATNATVDQYQAECV